MGVLQINSVYGNNTLPEESSSFTSVCYPLPVVCVRTGTERPEAVDTGYFILAGIDGKRLLQTVDMAVRMDAAGTMASPYRTIWTRKSRERWYGSSRVLPLW